MKNLKKYTVRAFFTLLVFLAFFGLFTKRLRQPQGEYASSPTENLKSGLVTAVFDGDTVKIRLKSGRERKVRLIGVDSPEIGDRRKEASFWAHIARRFSFYHLYREEVKVTFDWQLEDSYQRLLAYVWKGDVLFNDFIIRQGYASAYLKFPFRKDYQKKFKESEELARKEGRGFWRTEGFPRISVFDVRRHLGELVTVAFTCVSVERKRRFLFLQSPGREFAALIPQKYLSSFPKKRAFLNRELFVSGFLEEYKSQPQIVLNFPSQVDIMKSGDMIPKLSRSFFPYLGRLSIEQVLPLLLNTPKLVLLNALKLGNRYHVPVFLKLILENIFWLIFLISFEGETTLKGILSSIFFGGIHVL